MDFIYRQPPRRPRIVSRQADRRLERLKWKAKQMKLAARQVPRDLPPFRGQQRMEAGYVYAPYMPLIIDPAPPVNETELRERQIKALSRTALQRVATAGLVIRPFRAPLQIAAA